MLFVSLCAPAFVQKAPNMPLPPRNLEEALQKTYWNVEQRGPLLAIAPEWERWEKQEPLPLPPEQGYNAKEISDAFNRVPLRAGGMTVIAPQTMRLFKVPTIAPEKIPLTETEAQFALLGSLTRAQWERVGSESGLGLSDLSDSQRPYFEALLPPPGVRLPLKTPLVLTDASLSKLRLRLFYKLKLRYFPHQSERVPDIAEQEPYWIYPPESQSRSTPPEEKLFPLVRNQLKPSELSFASPRLDTRVSLTDLKTLGELVERVGAAVRLKLHTDLSLTELPLFIRGTSARAGDVLQSLCLGVCGTFRKLDDTTFLLTEDIEGLAVRQAGYFKWQQKRDGLAAQRYTTSQKRIKESGATLSPERKAEFSPELQKRLAAPNGAGFYTGTFTQDELPDFMKERIQSDKKRAASASEPYSLRTDKVALRADPTTEWVLPGVGALPYTGSGFAYVVTGASFSSPQPLPPTTPLFAPSWRQRVLVLTPKTVEQATEAVALTKQAGLTTLWVTVAPENASAKSLLEAALAAGKTQGIKIGAQVTTLLQPTDSPFVPNRTILGETLGSESSHFVLPSPSLATQISQQLKTLATLPELAGALVPNDFGIVTNRQQGYTPENRQAFFQKTGTDVLDLSWVTSPSLGYFSMLLGEKEQDRAREKQQKRANEWIEFRGKPLTDFFTTLNTTVLSLPYTCYSNNGMSEMLGLWKYPQTPQYDREYLRLAKSPQSRSVLLARQLSPVTLHLLSPDTLSSPLGFHIPLTGTWLASRLRSLALFDSPPLQTQGIMADGVVLDLSLTTFTDAKKLLEELK